MLNDMVETTDIFDRIRDPPRSGTGRFTLPLLTADDRRALLAEALRRTAGHDHDAFRVVYTLTSNVLFGICMRVCRDRSVAEDILADVYVTVWKRAGKWDMDRGSGITWLSRIARNRAIDWQRARARRGTEVADDYCDVADETPGVEALLIEVEHADQVRDSLNALVPEQQSAIRSAFFDGLSYPELAARHGVPLGTMKSRIRRGLRQMRNDLQACEELGRSP